MYNSKEGFSALARLAASQEGAERGERALKSPDGGDVAQDVDNNGRPAATPGLDPHSTPPIATSGGSEQGPETEDHRCVQQALDQPESTRTHKAETNRRNSQHSTGPKTPQGKCRSSRNAVRWGTFAKTVLLRGENAKAFSQLKKRMRDDYSPEDDLEQLLFDQVVNAMWRLRRLDAAEQGYLEHFQKKQACQLEPRITIVDGKTIDVGDELDDALDRFAENANPSDEDLRRALRRLIDSPQLERTAQVRRERRKLLKELLDLLEKLAALQAKRQPKY